MGHLGSRVSALLDGQLPTVEQERCWQHVHACHACRDLVEREGWVKARLSGLDADTAGLPGRLALTLRQPDLGGPGGWDHRATVGPPAVGRRRTGVLVIGGAGAGAAALGVALLVLVPGSPSDLRPPASSLSGAGSGAVDGAGAPQRLRPGHQFVPVRSSAP